MNKVHTNEEVSEVVNIYMWAVQRRPYWVCAVMVRDADEKGSPLWCWEMSFAFSSLSIAERVVIRVTTGPERQPLEPSGPESGTVRVKGTE
jgi:hypothetical protein